MMKALTLHRPWPTLIASGRKTIETRSWRTSYRGPLAIHAGNKIDPWCARENGLSGGEPGVLVAVCDLVDVVRMTRDHEKQAMCPTYLDAWAWILKNIKPVMTVVRVRGSQGLWTLDPEIEKQIVVAC